MTGVVVTRLAYGVFGRLSRCDIKVLLCVIDNLPRGGFVVKESARALARFCDMPIGSFMRAKKRLETLDLLCQVGRERVAVNPMYAYVGASGRYSYERARSNLALYRKMKESAHGKSVRSGKLT